MSMNAIVMNTLTGAVSEYENFPFQSITGEHAGSAVGLWHLDGEDDAGQPIFGAISTGKKEWTSSLKKHVEQVYVAVKGSGCAGVVVHGEQRDWRYSMLIRPSGQSRCTPGRGIRENYLGFSFEATQPFQLDRIEVLVAESKTRRI